MNKIFLELIPIVIIFVIGFTSRKFNILKKEDGDLLLKLIFYLSLPALILFSITSVELSKEFLFIPFVAMWIILTTFFISLLARKVFFADNTYFNLVSRVLSELKDKKLVEVVNPEERTGRIYRRTKEGEKVAKELK